MATDRYVTVGDLDPVDFRGHFLGALGEGGSPAQERIKRIEINPRMGIFFYESVRDVLDHPSSPHLYTGDWGLIFGVPVGWSDSVPVNQVHLIRH